MLDKGARNIVLLSRSSIPKHELFSAFPDARKTGVKLEAISCDISDFQCLKSVLEDIKQTMPAIKGCRQAAIVLQVSELKYLNILATC